MITRIKGYDDAIPGYAVWSLTRQIIARQSRGESVGTIEACLAYAPRRDGGLDYVQGFAQRRVPTLHCVVPFSVEAEAALAQLGNEATGAP